MCESKIIGGNRLIEDLISDSIQKTKRGKLQKLFLNTDNTDYIANLINSFIEDKFGGEVNLIERNIKDKKFLSPYYPFLEFIKEDLKGEGDRIEEGIEEADVYYFQRGILKDYLSGRPTSRYEEMMAYADNELDYEREELHRSLLNLMSLESSSKPNVYLVKNIQNIKPSTIQFIDYILSKNNESNNFFIFLFSQEYKLLSEQRRERWIKFLEGISKEDYYFSINSPKNSIEDREVVEKEIVLNRSQIEDVIDLSWDSFNLLALQEAKEYLGIVHKLILDKNITIDDKSYARLIKLSGDVYNLLEITDQSLDYYNLYLNFVMKKNYKREIVDAYRKLSIIHLKNFSLEKSENEIIKALKLARELGDDILILKANIGFYEVLTSHKNFGSKKADEIYSDLYNELEDLSDKYNYYNINARICGTIAGDTSIQPKQRMHYCNKGIEVAKKTKNKNRLASLYHNKGMIYSVMGDDKRSFEFYKKSEKIKLGIGNILEIIRIYNGLGYAYFYVENYEEAVRYYKKALPFLKRTKDYGEIASNFYNIGITYFFALEYKSAIEYFEETLTLLDILNSDNIPFHSIHSIYSLLAFSYFKVSKVIKAKENINKIHISQPTFNEEEINYYKIAKAIMEKEEGNPYKAIDIFEELIDNADMDAFHKYLIPKVYYEYALLLKDLDEARRAKEILKDGIQISNKLGYDFHKSLMIKESKEFEGKVVEVDRLKFADTNFDIDSIIEYIKQETIMNNLYKRIDEINFLNKLQKIFLESKSGIDETIEEICNLIDITFTIDLIGFYLKKGEKLFPIYISEAEFKLEADKVVNIFAEDKDETFISEVKNYPRLKDRIKEFESIINIPFINKGKIIGNMILANKNDRFPLDQDVLRILSIATKQMVVAFSNKELEKKVKAKNRELERVNSSVKNLLDNVGQGFLSFGSDLLIDKEYSLECKNIFGFDIGKKKFSHIIDLSQGEKDLVDEIFRELLALEKENIIKEEMYRGLLPNLLELNGSTIEVKYNSINLKNRNKIMVILTDISEKIELENKMRAERSNLKMVVKAVSNQNDFKNRIDDYRKYANKGIKEMLSKDINSKDLLYDIYRAVHTFKGDFSQWYMFNSIKNLQEIEGEISKLIKINHQSNREEIIAALDNLELDELLDDDLDLIVSILGYDFFEVEETITITKSSIIDIEEQILSTFEPNEYNFLLPQIRRWRYKSLKEILASYPGNVMALAERLGKKVGEFNFIGDDILVEEEVYYGFVKSLVHIFRNILDHGIEEPEERINNGKEEKGQIFCSVKEVGFDIVILIGDDGRGIDLDLIKERAVERGFYNIERVDNLAEGELLDLIFADEFSTKEVIDNISGRGIGLSAVKSEVEKLGGTIEVYNKDEKGCEFKITLPHKEKLLEVENSIELIMDIFLEKLTNFFESKIEITLFEAGRMKNRDIKPYLKELKVVLDIDSTELYNVILTVDYDLAKELLNSFLIGDVSESEEEELIQEALEETLNIVVGNSIQYLEDNKNSILFSPPIRLNIGELDFDLRRSSNLTLRLKTIYGGLTLSLVLKK